MDALILVLCILFQCWYCDNICFFFIFLKSCIPCAPSPCPLWENEKGTLRDDGGVGRAHMSLQTFLSTLIPKAAHLAEKEWLLCRNALDPSPRSKLFWVMTYSIFPTRNIYYQELRQHYFNSVVIQVHHKCKEEVRVSGLYESDSSFWQLPGPHLLSKFF